MQQTQATGKNASAPKLMGLTDAEVAQRVAEGLVNTNADVKTKSVSQIVSEHTFTFFNAVNLCLAILVMFTGEYKNMLFMGVVFSNL
ncbi:MAG: haloacid dehalogenase, partial [Atopobiaceae bacterium]|nr:haloacid dehalogenase [Atopobiaceae bacterium]